MLTSFRTHVKIDLISATRVSNISPNSWVEMMTRGRVHVQFSGRILVFTTIPIEREGTITPGNIQQMKSSETFGQLAFN